MRMHIIKLQSSRVIIERVCDGCTVLNENMYRNVYNKIKLKFPMISYLLKVFPPKPPEQNECVQRQRGHGCGTGKRGAHHR